MIQPMNAFIQQVGYKLTVIEDEEVPLALNLNMEYYSPVIITLVLLAVLLIAIAYLSLCEKQRKRIMQLDIDRTAYCGWNLNLLKETVQNLEAERVDEMNLDFFENGDLIFDCQM